MRGFPIFRTGDPKLTYKALNELMLDYFKVRESRSKQKRATAQEELAAEAGKVGEDEKVEAECPQQAANKSARFEARRPVAIYILDRDDQIHHSRAGRWY